MSLIVLDFNRTVYDPDTDELIPGAYELLCALRDRECTIILISRKEGGRGDKLIRLGIERFFAETLFVEEKTASLFKKIVSCYKGERVYVLGDYLHEEIRFGNMAGAYTIHFKQGRFADLAPEGAMDIACTTITNLIDSLSIIE